VGARRRGLAELLRRERLAEEDEATAALVRALRHVKHAREFTRAELVAMCRWKSPRAQNHYRRNAPATVRKTSREALRARGERDRLERLTSLEGVSVPTASAILTLIDPRRYGVIDIRVWQLLFRLGAVDRKPRGVGFRSADWEQYLSILRRHARALGVPVRRVELTLFEHHRKTHTGALYASEARHIRRGGRG